MQTVLVFGEADTPHVATTEGSAKGMRILIADDSAVSRRLLEADLTRWGFDVIGVGSGAEAWTILQEENAPRMVILDWMMPGLSGPEVCRLVRGQHRSQYTYILLLTSRNEKEDLIEGMESGADDYLVKPFDQNELKVRLGPGLRIVELQQQLEKAQEALREQATCDALTRLWNRHAIFEILERELARCARKNLPLGLIMADIDHFKEINDTVGHIGGDHVLAEVARRIRNSIRPYDAAGRYGGEEFLLILPGCELSQAHQTAERIRMQVKGTPVQPGEEPITLTISIGVTALTNGFQTDLEGLIRQADRALYQAKQRGRDQTVSLPIEEQSTRAAQH